MSGREGDQGPAERRLTPGERNELRRRERKARRAEGGTDPAPRTDRTRGASASRNPGGADPAPRARGASASRNPSGADPAPRARGASASRNPGGADGAPAGATGRAGAAAGRGRGRSGGEGRARTGSEGRGGDQRERASRPAPRPAAGEDRREWSARKVHRHQEASVAAAAADGVHRAGFACFVGRPNAGKSTLTNAIVGQKIAITSNRPQTTRHIIRGILHREDAQLVLVDTPGLHRPRTLLGERLNDLVREVWSEVDVIGVCFPADEPVGRGDRFISAELQELKATVVAVVTKVDLVDPPALAKHLLAVSELHDFADIVPVSAVSGHQVRTLVDVLIRHLPESPRLYPDDVLTDEPEQVLIAELIREAALEGVRDELPHSIAVLVEEMLVEGNLTKIYADVYVERDSQKSIVIGSRGARLKEVGIKARAGIEELIGRRVYLDLHVRVAKEWQRDPRQLRKLGF
jgi:GTP-binding protein Era